MILWKKANPLVLALIFTFLFFLPAFAEKKIAVLPFDVPKDRTDMELYGLGTVDTITMALSNITEFTMIDRSKLQAVMKENAFQQSGFADQEKVVKIGKLLGADILVIGIIQIENGKYRMSARLTEVETGKILKVVQVTGTSIFDLQDQLAGEIVAHQNVELTDNRKQQIASVTRATSDITAYDFYIKGRSEFLSFTPEGYQKSLEYLDKSIEADGSYTLALAAKAETLALWTSELEKVGEPYKDKLELAEKYARQALELAPGFSEVHRSMSTVFQIQKKYEEGKKEALKAIELNKNDAEAYVVLWDNIYRSNSMEDPSLIKKALEINPYLVSAHLDLSKIYQSGGEFAEAIAEAKKAIEISPKSITAYILLGNIYLAQIDAENAWNSYSKALELDNRYSSAYAGLGIIYQVRGDYPAGLKMVQKALEIYPENGFANYFMATMYRHQEEYDKALEYLEKTVKSNVFPADFANTEYGLIYLGKGDMEKAFYYIRLALRINPDNAYARTNLGVLYEKEKKYDEAAAEFNKVLKVSPDNVYASLYLIKVLYGKNDFDGTLKLVNNLIAKTKDFSFPYLIAGRIYYKQGKYNEAIEVLKPGIKLSNNKELEGYYFMLADSYLKLKKYNEAIEQFKEEIKISPDNAEAYNSLGVACHLTGKIKEAVEQYRQAIKVKPDYAVAYDNLGISLEVQGNSKEAINMYKKACELGNTSSCDWLKKLNN
jgi:tetratricopeptide (TPR) repeat protein/TolB-like protein